MTHFSNWFDLFSGKYSIWEFHVPGTRNKKDQNIQIEHEKYVCIAIISLIYEYVIWKWHIFQIDLIHSPENSKSGHFMSPGQDIKRPKYAIFLTEICLSFSNIICFWICDLQIMFCGYFSLHSLMKMKKNRLFKLIMSPGQKINI